MSITVFGVNSTSLYVTWEVPELPRGVIEFYQVEYSSICSATTRMNTTANSTHTYLSGLSPFTEYTVHVRAFTVEFGNFSVERRRMTSEAGELKLNMNAHIHVQYAHIYILYIYAHARTHLHTHTLRFNFCYQFLLQLHLNQRIMTQNICTYIQYMYSTYRIHVHTVYVHNIQDTCTYRIHVHICTVHTEYVIYV